MALRLITGIALVGAVITTVVMAALGTLPVRVAIDVVAGTAALASVLALVKLPWDLWFAARSLVSEQDESVRRGIAIDPEARVEAKRIAARSLAVAVGLHALAAIAAFAASELLGDGRGRILALAYLSSMALRPIQAGWWHVQARIHALRREASIPREDAVTLLDEVRARRVRDDEREARLGKMERDVEAETMRTRESVARLDVRLDRVLVELERSAERLTDDRELVAGLRALAKMLRTAA